MTPPRRAGRATGGIVSVGQSILPGEHGCSIVFRPHARQVIQTVPAGWFDEPAETAPDPQADQDDE